jgi:hypothetical protein
MIAVDTNILVYAHREESSWHKEALAAVTRLAEGRTPWAIAWPCIHEFIAVVTHPGIFDPPVPPDVAVRSIEALLTSPSLVLLAEPPTFWKTMRKNLVRGRVRGRLVHDAKIASICEIHGVSEIWTADRDFSRFPSLKAVNPLV